MLLVFCLWSCFYVLHSALASGQAKRMFSKFENGYRLFYNLVALTTFALALRYTAGGQPIAWLANNLVHWLGLILLVGGIIVLFFAAKGYDLLVFAGFKPELSAGQALQTKGLNAYVRHPLYSGTLLFLFGWWLAIRPTDHWAAVVAATCAYLPFGIKWEEDKLRAVFGQAWHDYANRVKAIIPGLI
jgi:methanethiol S-methyltransferase